MKTLTRHLTAVFATVATPWLPTAFATGPDAVLAVARAEAGVGDSAYVGYGRTTGVEQEGGLSGNWRNLIDLATGRTRVSADFGIFSSAAVWKGRHMWRQDTSVGVHPIDSQFMRGFSVTDAWLAQFEAIV